MGPEEEALAACHLIPCPLPKGQMLPFFPGWVIVISADVFATFEIPGNQFAGNQNIIECDVVSGEEHCCCGVIVQPGLGLDFPKPLPG